MSQGGGRPLVLIHGAWVTAESWDTFRQPFDAAGYTVHTPTWPMLGGRSAGQLNENPPPGFGALTTGAIVDHLQAFIATLPEAPLLVGHSFGGLFTQMLLDRGVGRAGVAINPVPIGGIVPGPTSLTAVLPAVARWNGWNRPYAMSRRVWSDRFANTAPLALQNASYDTYVIPTSGRILHQAATWLGTVVRPARRKAPLLITGSEGDRLITPYISRATLKLQRHSAAPTDFTLFANRSHLLIAEPGWEEVASRAINWAASRGV
jgi:pimeloyl-ACP methyl ester carboxylesterase